MKTRRDVERLKSEWECDPIWDLEDTEGFEEYREELLAFRLQKEKEWRKERERRFLRYAKDLGLSKNLELARYLEALERKIETLEEKVLELTETVGRNRREGRLI
ncbi:MAG: hypothetical protein GXO16_05850 [Epsilonproteobacteria bacterium]|nr:hypothetical protein [Campylobacterota bacterium]